MPNLLVKPQGTSGLVHDITPESAGSIWFATIWPISLPRTARLA